MGGVADHVDVLVLLRIHAGLDGEFGVARVDLLHVGQYLGVDADQLDVAGAGQIHHRRGGNRRPQREHLCMAVLHHRYGIGVGVDEIHLRERLVGHAVDLQYMDVDELRGVAFRLGDQHLALQVADAVDV